MSVKIVPHEHFGYPQPEESCFKLVIQFPDDSSLEYAFVMKRANLQSFLLDVEMKKSCSLGGIWFDYFRESLIHYGASAMFLHLNDYSTFRLGLTLSTLLIDELTRVYQTWST